MAQNEIHAPPDQRIDFNGGSVFLRWPGNFAATRNAMMLRKQKIVDSEVLRYCAPLIPFRTGTLTRSGTIGTVIGSGNVQYATPYARFQYYQTAQSRSYDSRRGAKWFERMKTAHKADIQRAAERG